LENLKKEIIMPSMSLDMEEGTIIEWLVGEGDSIEEEQEIAEIETDKAATILESSLNGTITEIVVEAGEKAAVGETIAWVEMDDE
jgi:pyruvate/2-oxoglutarate dehydrogenase complex dihydrolipoamide acyltransferase (E2) component